MQHPFEKHGSNYPMPKQNFNEKLIALLKTNPDFVDDSGETPSRCSQGPRMETRL